MTTLLTDRYSLAQQHLRALMLGIEISTGEPLDATRALSDPDVIRSLLLAREALERFREEAIETSSNESDRAGEPWSSTEDHRLRMEYLNGKSLSELQAEHGRSRGGILSRLVRIGIVASREEARVHFRSL